MCYKAPELTEEDKRWNGRVDSDEEASDDAQHPAQVRLRGGRLL